MLFILETLNPRDSKEASAWEIAKKGAISCNPEPGVVMFAKVRRTLIAAGAIAFGAFSVAAHAQSGSSTLRLSPLKVIEVRRQSIDLVTIYKPHYQFR